VQDVHLSFGGVRAVGGASFTVSRGTITGLIGPNGAGKSTIVGLVAGALRPASGRILFEGRDITGKQPHEVARRGILRTFQLASEFARLTVLENLLVAAPAQAGESFRGALLGRRHWRRRELEDVERARSLLLQFGLADKADDYGGSLSGGQRRLLELARALMASPRLLLLDEPMAGVNPVIAREIEGYLVALRQDGLTTLMIEHELDVVERICDRVIVMAQGRVLTSGSMREVRGSREVQDAYIAG
jgi:ABC-type branched-subunit amino acid transport system ATPase component